MSVNYTVRQEDTVTVLDLSGRILRGEVLAFGPGSVLELHEVVRDLVQKGHKRVVLNLRHVTYIDSCGLGELVGCLTTLQNHEGEMRICHATPRVAELLRFTHLDSVLHYDEDEAAALQALMPRVRRSAA
jgi:anti-sigma B factor antagonist